MPSNVKRFMNFVRGEKAVNWTYVENLTDPGLDISGYAMPPGDCYIEVFVESLRLKWSRQFTSTFNGVIYSFLTLPQFGSGTVDLAAISKPQKLAELDPDNLDRVIPVSKRMAGAIPWHGGPLGLELGLFAVRQKELLTPILDYVVSVSDLAGISQVTQIKPFLPLISDGLKLLSGQKDDTEIIVGIDQDMTPNASMICAIIAAPTGTYDADKLSLDPTDRRLLYKGRDIEDGYCVYSIRTTTQKTDWADIEDLQTKFSDVQAAMTTGQSSKVQEAVTAFNMAVYACVELIMSDRLALIEKVKAYTAPIFAGGMVSATLKEDGGPMTLADMNIYS